MDWWMKTGCFLTGYKYEILKNCSEVAQRAVKRYTAALLIIGILWAFIGYSFVGEYLKGNWYMSLIGAIVFVLIILQVERQIILADAQGKLKYWIRGAIAGIMAIIGSVVIDQIIFQQDIAQKSMFAITTQVDQLMPSKEAVLRKQTAQIDSSLYKKEAERSALVADLSAHPTIKMVTTEMEKLPVSSSVTDSNRTTVTNTKMINSSKTLVSYMANPKRDMLDPLDNQIKELRTLKIAQENRLMQLRTEVENEARANKGFLFELQLMYDILHDSTPAFVVWLLWFLLLFGIEIFIMVNKLSHLETDYDVSIQHHMELRKRKLKLLATRYQ
ncbi:DUF4407 domain-containing protein [Pedobacter sp. AW31-3R]|uniref:DUF4407 domain-containing protein n=1 Tax=Pedobacter sp. AW31-3R TaxID=3445781 RepID=UPI003F9EBCE4